MRKGIDPRYYYEDSDGVICGKNPNDVTTEDLIELGVESSFRKMIRKKCVDCCGGSEKEVRLCTAIGCPLWAFRMGNNPLRGKVEKERGKVGKKEMEEWTEYWTEVYKSGEAE